MGRLSEILSLAQSRAREMNLHYEGALTPREAYEISQLIPGARIVDVRTKAELDWVGRVPGAIEIEWLAYPGNQLNVHFIQTLKHSVSTESMLMFLCRSGQRSSRPVAPSWCRCRPTWRWCNTIYGIAYATHTGRATAVRALA